MFVWNNFTATVSKFTTISCSKMHGCSLKLNCRLRVVAWCTGIAGIRLCKFLKAKTFSLDLEEKAKAEAAKGNKTLQSLLNYLNVDKAKTKEEGFTLGFGDWCRCMCCPRPEERPREMETAEVGILMDIRFYHRQCFTEKWKRFCHGKQVSGKRSLSSRPTSL